MTPDEPERECVMDKLIRILLIDDEEDFCFFVKGNLEAGGQFKVLTVNNGSEGLESAKRIRPDLILLDMVMPDMSGDEVALELARDSELKDTPVIFLTAIVTRDETGNQNLSRIGGRYFIAKPIDTQGLIQAIHHVLHHTSDQGAS
ncbi:MAG: response regulator [Desulfohalobiaceae bacterium]|nr:response regulator [Desulfohalobiaceae bacterium]